MDQDVVIIADPYDEEHNEEIAPDILLVFFSPEQLPEVSFEIVPTRVVPPGTIQKRTLTAFGPEIPRRRFSYFGYPPESDSNHKMMEEPIPDLQLVFFPKLDDLEPLFSHQEEVLPGEPTRSLSHS